jgi:hypothetical protein
MNQTAIDDQDEKPLDPAMERVRRKMLRLLAVSIGIMFTGLMAVLIAIVYKVSNGPSKPKEAGASHPPVSIPGDEAELSGKIALPAGARAISQSLSGGQLSLLIEVADGSRQIVIYDMNAGRIIARYTIIESGK